MRNARSDVARAPRSDVVQAVSKMSAVLEAFEDRESQTLGELAARTGIPKPSVFRIATTLEGVGLLDRDRRGSYVLGLKLASLARGMLSLSLPQAARPAMEELHRAFGYTVSLGVLDRGEMLFVEVLESRHSFRMASTIGAREPIHATALGKAVAAYLAPEELSRILAEHPVRALTANTITSRSQLDKELDLVRDRGYATDVGECYAAAHAAAAAIFDRHGIAGAMSMSAPSSQLSIDRLAPIGAALEAASRTISRALGGERALRRGNA